MRRVLLGLTFSILASALFLGIGWALSSGTGVVKGSVNGPGGPLTGVEIVVSSASVSSYTAKTVTDQTGSYSVTDAPVGGVVVKVYDAKGKMLVSGKGSLTSAGQVITITLQTP
jgi:hypothetical protein